MLKTDAGIENLAGAERVPYISVIVPAYNASRYIGEALDSIFEQTLSDFEVIVVNDGSPDTQELERVLNPYHGRINYIRQENRGAAAARNTALRASRGELVAFLDSDDRWLPTYLAEQIDLLVSSNSDVVYADALLIGDSHLAGRTYMELAPSRRPVTAESLLAVDVGVITSGVLARKSSIIEVGLFDESIRRGHDFDLWLRLAKNGTKFSCQRKILLHYRVLKDGLSGNQVSQIKRCLAVLDTIEKQRELTEPEMAALRRSRHTARAQLALENGKEKLQARDFAGAYEAFQQAKKLRSGWKLAVVCLWLRIAPQLLWRVYRFRSTPS